MRAQEVTYALEGMIGIRTYHTRNRAPLRSLIKADQSGDVEDCSALNTFKRNPDSNRKPLRSGPSVAPPSFLAEIVKMNVGQV